MTGAEKNECFPIHIVTFTKEVRHVEPMATLE